MSLEAQEIAVRLRLLGGTAFNAEADASANSIRGIGDAAEQTNGKLAMGGSGGFFANAGKSLDTVNGKLKTFARSAAEVGRHTAIVSGGLALGIGASVKKYMDTEGLFRLLESQDHATKAQRNALEAFEPNMSKYAVGPKEYAEALYPVFSVLKDVKQTEDAVTKSAMGAAIGHDSLLHSSEALVAFWRDGAKGVHSFSEEMALLDETVGAGKMHLPELAQIASTGLMQTYSAAVHGNQRDLLAVIAGTSQGVSEGGVEQYATRLRTTLLKMTGLKGEALASAKQLGLGKTTLEDTIKSGPGGLIQALRMLAEAEKRVGQDRWAHDISSMFGGSRGAGSIYTAIQDLPQIEKILKELEGVHGTGTLQKHMSQTEQTAEFRKHQIKAELENMEFSIGKIFTPTVLTVMEKGAELLKTVVHTYEGLPSPLKDVLKGLLIFGVLLSPTAFLISGLATVGRLFTGLGGTLFGVESGMGETALASGAAGAGLSGLIVPLGLAAAALALFTEGGKHPFNPVEEAWDSIFGGYTAKEREEKRALEKEDRSFLHKVHGEEALQRRHFERTHPHPWSGHIKNPQLRRETEELEGVARRVPHAVGQIVKHLEVHLHVDKQHFGKAVIDHTPTEQFAEKANEGNRARERRR